VAIRHGWPPQKTCSGTGLPCESADCAHKATRARVDKSFIFGSFMWDDGPLFGKMLHGTVQVG
jgi:hypothetical protein